MRAPIANEVRRLRREQDLTQDDLGAAIGVARQTIIAIEQGGDCGLATAMRLARRLGTTVQDLFPIHYDNAAKEMP